ncbi:MAG: hypothetical protein C4575_01135 [Desulforudis sp.]|nr:zf-TFIIB domain-containing protein [Clostridia bacterium]MDQ7790999.1 zf-TFIIB domain-containing protein [Clostridia bacterium]RJX22592.1 MAG: hypothetical protein C4575_01135 [Desulforudis sp.]
MQCPACDAELRMTDRQGVEIDYCPKCRGVWLDRGELDKIVERAQPASFEEQADRHPKDFGRHEERYEPKKRKRKSSFLGELFDFD